VKTNVIIVPDLGMVLSDALKAGFTVDQKLAQSAALLKGCRKTYGIETWTPARSTVSAPELRYHFKDGFGGCAAAFIAWLTREKPNTSFATPGEPEKAAYTGQGEAGIRTIGWHEMPYWLNNCSFVAFKEVER
jgi:hypothetical protein